MAIIEFFKNLTETFKTIKYRRETEKIFETKFYAFSSAVTGITSGVVIGIAVLIIQLAFPELQDGALLPIVLSAFGIALLAFDVWMVYPLVLDKSIQIMEKLISTFVTLIVTIAGFLLGVYGVLLVIVIAVIYLILKVVLPTMFKR